jgi:cobalt-zinc-cadmium efflux system outer membrane protein
MRGKAYQAGLYPNPAASGGATQLAGDESQYFAALSQEIVTKRKLLRDQAAVCREVAQVEFRYVRTRFELLTAVRQGYFVTLAAQGGADATGRYRGEVPASRFSIAGGG